MSRTVMSRALLAAMAAVLLVSCNRFFGGRVAGDRPTSPMLLQLTCHGGLDSIALTGANGVPAWVFEPKRNDDVEWRTVANVTIDSIVSKPRQDPLPLDPPLRPGGPFRSKVKGNADRHKHFYYSIFATCRPTSGPAVRMMIDPDMIIRY